MAQRGKKTAGKFAWPGVIIAKHGVFLPDDVDLAALLDELERYWAQVATRADALLEKRAAQDNAKATTQDAPARASPSSTPAGTKAKAPRRKRK